MENHKHTYFITMKTNKKSSQTEKARIGAIGENNVVSKLMQQGWDAFNANCTIKNYKSIDIVCIDSDSCDPNTPWRPATVFVQVKTSFQNNIPIGFSIKECLDKESLEKKVMGAYVFVYVKEISKDEWCFRYFIISRKDFIELAHQAHKHYVYDWVREEKGKPLNDEGSRINGILLNAPAGFNIKWLKGDSDKATQKHTAFINPLNGKDCENEWKNIWKE